MAFSLVDGSAIGKTLYHPEDDMELNQGKLTNKRPSSARAFESSQNPTFTQSDNEESNEEMEPFLSSSCPSLSTKPSTQRRDEMEPLHRPLGSQSVHDSMHSAMSYVEGSMQTAKEIGLHAKESLHHALESVDRFAHKVWDGRWRLVSHFQLPEWQRDNEFLHNWHRPPMPSFRACFGSIFRLHSETGNIWTHLIGFVMFIGICIYFQCLDGKYFVIEWQEKIVFTLFFLGAILCLCFSTLFHTLGCHSERVYRIFGKLDYSGISLMIMGSFVPWIYYSFYCDTEPKIVYMTSVCVLGVLCIVISQWDKFSTARFRRVRAILFAALGLSGIIPCIHTIVKFGFTNAVMVGQIGWLALMAFLYLFGAFLYAQRIPERYFPGKCDLWFQSHQIFHILVVLAAVVHFHGISNLQHFRFQDGNKCIAHQ